MTLAAMDALEKDAATKRIIVISKPPAPSVAAKIAARAKRSKKPVTLCLLGARNAAVRTLEAAAGFKSKKQSAIKAKGGIAGPFLRRHAVRGGRDHPRRPWPARERVQAGRSRRRRIHAGTAASHDRAGTAQRACRQGAQGSKVGVLLFGCCNRLRRACRSGRIDCGRRAKVEEARHRFPSPEPKATRRFIRSRSKRCAARG